MENQSYGRRMWSIWSPLVIKYAIATVVTSVVLFFFTGAGMMQQGKSGEITKLMEEPDHMAELMQAASECLMDYAVPLEGAAALVTIPVMLFFMNRDKKKLKKELMMKGRAPLWN